MKEIADCLYHYTNLSSLALILKNKSVMFSSLRNMDDLEEAKVSENRMLGKYCFVSCWTDVEEEKLSLWNMYTRDMTGVRIKLRKLPFETYSYKIKKHNIDIEVNDSFYYEELSDKPCAFPVIVDAFDKENLVKKIIYTDDENLIFPNIIKYNLKDNTVNLSLGDLGIHKRKEWSFQDEVRYRAVFLPYGLKDFQKMSGQEIYEALFTEKDLSIQSCLFKIKQEYFEKIEITTGPKMNEGDREILKTLVDKYCPTAILNESKFKDKIKL